ncbi:MAG: AraC family transcriptional regulator, partial [Pseudomonadales bacterium]|nr:AraC family transcriptional regulator [Pseudomonadales bacterium]
MNIYKQLNLIITHIENNLDSKIEYKHLANILFTNSYVMQRLFQLLTNTTLTQYIKERRLSRSVSDIINGEKIIDVALKYRYSSSESFSRAFKTMHGINPSLLKSEVVKLNLTPVLKFNESQNKNGKVDYHIVKNKGFHLHTHNFDCTLKDIEKHTENFWKKIKKTHPSILETTKRYGVVEYKNHKQIRYHAGLKNNTI